ncbi:hypothetical protein F5050DRAFT_1809003 [Lentinula boryana]|uniref:Uncharacterized protein n=1 Tax=Lentinula boryana TaxID=40481 RepID=A0ABQ8Q965_9AGAR|nr:hypothetical protein F5050DRAFT_1809003 [Lentinula boryana]
MSLSTSQLSPLPLKLLDLEMLSPPSAICPADTLSPLDELSSLKCFSPPTSTYFRTDSEDVIVDSSTSNEWYVHCETMDKNTHNEYYTPQDPGLRNALQLSPEPDVVLSCWQTDSAFSFYNCMHETSSDNGTGPPPTISHSHVCDDAPQQQIINPIIAPSPVHSLLRWLKELEEMVDSLVREEEHSHI